MKRSIFFAATTLLCLLFAGCTPCIQKQIIIVGGGASGTAAGIQAARLGSETLIVEEFDWLGGALTSAGVSCVDGNYDMPAGIFGEFRKNLEKHYGGADKLRTGWVSNVCAEPSAMFNAFKQLADQEKKLEVWYRSTVTDIQKKKNGWIVTIQKEGKKVTVACNVLIDGTELGDVAKACGATYDIGMDDKKISGEAIAPEEANNVVQDLTYVAILKDYGKGNAPLAEAPKNYNPELFYCTCKSDKCIDPKGSTLWEKDQMINYGKLPGGKYMINWPIHGNDYYANIIEMNKEQRDSVLQEAKNFTLGYIHYLQTELGFDNLGLADDEYPTTDRLPFIPYHRESRRIHGVVRFNLNHMTHPYDQEDPLYRTCIAVGDYPVDHHHGRYDKKDELPKIHFHPVPSFGLPLGVIMPKEVSNLLVTEKSISVTNIVNGATRLQPVLVQIGQAAGTVAALAAQQSISPDKVSVREVQNILLEAGGYLLPYIDRPKDDAHFKALQRIGATGILRGRGANEGWKNRTYFDADSTLTYEALKAGLSEYDNNIRLDGTGNITIEKAFEIVGMMKKEPAQTAADEKSWQQLGLGNYDTQRNITRGEFAVLIDAVIDPFHTKDITIKGKYINQ